MKFILGLLAMVFFSQASFAQYQAFSGKGKFPGYSGRVTYYEYESRQYEETSHLSDKLPMVIIYKQWAEGKIRGSFDIATGSSCISVLSKKFIGIDEGFGAYVLYANEEDLMAKKSFGELVEYKKNVDVRLTTDWTANITGSVGYYKGGCSLQLYTSKVELNFNGRGEKKKK